MSTKTSLVIMAAGIGSRFGEGIKQLTKFGPGGEIIMDYSIYDAVQAGFDRVVFVIRKDLEKDFREIILNRLEDKVECALAFQEKDDLPEGFDLPKDRTKPWGTGQAILACRGIVKEPFCVINADDYYGKQAFKLVHDWLVNPVSDICMAGFILKNTLSDNGGVTRGVCSVDAEGKLVKINETSHIEKKDGGAVTVDDNSRTVALDPESLCSMNLWGFRPEFLDELEEGFKSFLSENIQNPKAEYLLPMIVDEKIQNGTAKVDVLPTTDKWFGVTYHEDIPTVKESFEKLAKDGVYPVPLW